MHPYPAREFQNSRNKFEAVVRLLAGEECAALDHAEVERRLQTEGHEVLRCLYQDHLDLRAEQEEVPPKPVRGADEEARTEVRPSARPLGSLFGTVVVRRRVLVKHGVAGGLHPLDAYLNLPKGKYSHGVQREVAWGVAQCSYDAAVENIRRTTGTRIAKRQAEELVLNFATDFQSFYLDQPRETDTAAQLLVMSFDGAGVVVRPEAMRTETKKKARKSRKKTAAETASDVGTPSIEPHRKRMAEVAAVYSLEVVSRLPEDVMQELRRNAPPKKRPKAKNKRVWASLERSIFDVVEAGFYEALQRDEEYKRRWVALVDANADQLDAIERMSQVCGKEVTIVVDLIHVLGYLWKAGKALHTDATPSVIEAWVTKHADQILRGEVTVVAAAIRRSATQRNLRGKRREAVDKCVTYLRNNKKYLRYDEYLRDGLPIATGVIEGACRSRVRIPWCEQIVQV